jgi:hypothetical protein
LPAPPPQAVKATNKAREASCWRTRNLSSKIQNHQIGTFEVYYDLDIKGAWRSRWDWRAGVSSAPGVEVSGGADGFCMRGDVEFYIAQQQDW